MNIEIQKYYTDNKIRIEYLENKIKSLKEYININPIYNSYESKIKSIVYAFAKENQLIIINDKELDLTRYSLMDLGKEIIKWNADDLGETDWIEYLEEAFDINGGIKDLLQLEDIMNVMYNIMKNALSILYNEGKLKELKANLKKYFEELRNYQKKFDDKILEVNPQIEVCKKEKEMLIQINKQLEKEYKEEIITLK